MCFQGHSPSLFLILTRVSVTRKEVQQKYFSRCFPFSPFSAYLNKNKTKQKNRTSQIQNSVLLAAESVIILV